MIEPEPLERGRNAQRAAGLRGSSRAVDGKHFVDQAKSMTGTCWKQQDIQGERKLWNAKIPREAPARFIIT